MNPLGGSGAAVERVLSPAIFQPTVVDKLQDSDERTRIKACVMLAACAFDAAARKGVMRLAGVEKLLAALAGVGDLAGVSDLQLQFFASAGGALRNLLVGGGEEFVAEMLSQAGALDLLIRIVRTAMQYVAGGCPTTVPSQPELRCSEANSLLEQALACIWQSCVHDERAVAAVSEAELLPELIPVLTSTRLSLVVTTSELIATATDECPPAIEQLWKASGAFAALVSMARAPITPQSCQTAVLASTILYNIRQRNNQLSAMKLVLGPAAEVLKVATNEEVGVLLERTRAVYASVNDVDKSSCEEGEAALKQISIGAAAVNGIIRAQNSALELLTNICSVEEDDAPMAEADEAPGDPFAAVPDEVRSLWRVGVDFASMRALLAPLPQLVLEDLAKFDMTFDGTAELLVERQEHVLTFLSNFFLVDEVSVVGPVDVVWRELMVVLRAFMEAGKEEPASAEALRALLRHQKDLSFVMDDDVRVIIEASRKTSSAIRCSAVGMMGQLGAFYTSKQPGGPQVVYLAEVLFAHIMDPSAVVLAEVVNALIDIFADDGNDACFRELDGLQKLTMCLKGMRTKAKQQARSLGHVGNILLEEALENLEAFIAYKSG